jgi:hypothetical protein
MNRFIVSISALALASSAHANSVLPVPGAQYFDIVALSGPNNTTIYSSGDVYTAGNLNYSSNGVRGSTSNNYNVPSLYATATLPGSGGGFSSYNANVESGLDYVVEFTGPSSTVSVNVQASGQVTSPYAFNGAADASLRIDGQTNLLNLFACTNACGKGTSFSFNGPIRFNTNQLYFVQMSTIISMNSSYTPGFTDTAYVDPYFTAPVGYSILTSQGVGNSPAATPLPAALPLFASALGVMGFLAKRRKRKTAAAVAVA